MDDPNISSCIMPSIETDFNFLEIVNEKLMEAPKRKSMLKPVFEAHMLFQPKYESPSPSPSPTSSRSPSLSPLPPPSHASEFKEFNLMLHERPYTPKQSKNLHRGSSRSHSHKRSSHSTLSHRRTKDMYLRGVHKSPHYSSSPSPTRRPKLHSACDFRSFNYHSDRMLNNLSHQKELAAKLSALTPRRTHSDSQTVKIR